MSENLVYQSRMVEEVVVWVIILYEVNGKFLQVEGDGRIMPIMVFVKVMTTKDVKVTYLYVIGRV